MNALLKICTLLLLTSFLSQAVQNRPNVSGQVVRAGTTDPVSDAEVTLNVAPPPAAFLAAANSSAARGISQPDLTATLIQLILLRPQEFQIALNQLKAQGWPEMVTLLNEWQGAREQAAGFPRRTVTDGSGRFSVADVPSGQYWVIAKRDGFFAVSSGGRAPSELVSVPVNIGTQSVSDVTVSMVPGALISGRVRDFAGRAQANVNVQVFTVSYQTNQPILQPVAAKTTDDRGEYRLFWLRPGDYFVAATPRQGAAPPPNSREAFVKSFHPNAADITKAIPVSVRIGDELSGIDIDIQAVPALKVSGQVISTLPAREPTGRGAQAGPVATLMLLRRDTSIPDDPTARMVGTVGLNGSTGNFEVTGLLPGTYDLYARIMDPAGSAGPGGGGVFAWGRTSLDVSNRDLEGVTIGVHASLDVNGVVIANGASLPTVLGSARVVIQPAASTAKIPQYQGIVNRAQTPKADGSFTVPTVAEGSYRVQVPGLPPNSYIADIQQNSVSVYDSGILVTDKTPAPLEIRVAANGGTVEGTVYTTDKKAAAFATVTLVPSLDHRQNPDLFKTVTSDAVGHFVISGVRPDDYRLLAWEKVPPGASQNASFVAKYEAQGSMIKVVAGTKATTDVSIVTGESAR
jgi:hypothetical protein